MLYSVTLILFFLQKEGKIEKDKYRRNEFNNVIFSNWQNYKLNKMEEKDEGLKKNRIHSVWKL